MYVEICLKIVFFSSCKWSILCGVWCWLDMKDLGKTGAQEPTRGLLPVVSEMQVKNLEEEKAIGPLSGVVNISGRF